MYADLLTQLRSYMQADADDINTYTSLIFTARCCERIGDHIKNVAEGVYFIIHGKVQIGAKLLLKNEPRINKA
jgi:phosphate transport system protein